MTIPIHKNNLHTDTGNYFIYFIPAMKEEIPLIKSFFNNYAHDYKLISSHDTIYTGTAKKQYSEFFAVFCKTKSEANKLKYKINKYINNNKGELCN